MEPSIVEESTTSRTFINSNYGGGLQSVNDGDNNHSGQGDQNIYGGVSTLNKYSGSKPRGM